MVMKILSIHNTIIYLINNIKKRVFTLSHYVHYIRYILYLYKIVKVLIQNLNLMFLARDNAVQL